MSLNAAGWLCTGRGEILSEFHDPRVSYYVGRLGRCLYQAHTTHYHYPGVAMRLVIATMAMSCTNSSTGEADGASAKYVVSKEKG